MDDGHAQVLVSAVQARFMGLLFRELSVSVLVSPDENGRHVGGVFLAWAAHSSRILCWCERVLFHAPYHLARIELRAQLPCFMEVRRANAPFFSATMSRDQPPQRAAPGGEADQPRSLPIFLPRGSTHREDRLPVFFALLRGGIQEYRFRPGRDELHVDPACPDAGVRLLAASGFQPRFWQIREDAMHARSRTYWNRRAWAYQATAAG